MSPRDPRREDDELPPKWHEEKSGLRRMNIEQKLASLPKPPAGKEADPFFSFIQQHNEVQRLDRIALFLDNEDKALAEEVRRRNYLRREQERDARDAARDKKSDERDAAHESWTAAVLEEFKRVTASVDKLSNAVVRVEERVGGLEDRMAGVEDESRKNTLQLSRLSGCVGKLEMNVEIISKNQKTFGVQLAQVDGKTQQIADQFEVAITDERARRHDVEHEVETLRARLDLLEKRFSTLESLIKADMAYRRGHEHGARSSLPPTAEEKILIGDHDAGDEGGTPPGSIR
jgi:chromosome segregation ATPase